MATKAIRVDEDVLAEIQAKANGKKTPNQILRETFGLPEKKPRRSKLLQDNMSKAKRYMLRAIELLTVEED